MSPPEVALWALLKNSAEGAPRIRRQHPIGPYIADFYCPAARLVIEIDGWSHNMGDQPARDERRDAWMEAAGYRVIRIPASEVFQEAAEVAERIVLEAQAIIVEKSSPA